MKTYVLCTTLEQHSIDTLKNLKGRLDLSNAIVHFVTIFEIKTYNLDLIPFFYPVEEQYAEMKNAAEGIIQSLADDLEIKKDNTVISCFFESNRETKIKKYLKEVEADLVVTATRGKHGIDGFFSSSFTEFLCKFSPCDVLVMRPRMELTK
jgi:nucleotide-binding universal stress UspA family protein